MEKTIKNRRGREEMNNQKEEMAFEALIVSALQIHSEDEDHAITSEKAKKEIKKASGLIGDDIIESLKNKNLHGKKFK